jgi:general secretion pathway protein D
VSNLSHPLRRIRATTCAIVCALGLSTASGAVGAPLVEPGLTFEGADIQVVVKEVARLTGRTFIFDPEQVRGPITLLAPTRVSAGEALALLESALALRGYGLVERPEATWIVPRQAHAGAPTATAVTVVPLTYARADEVARTLAWIAPPGVRVVPYRPTNSVILSGDPSAVEQLLDIIR